MSNRITNAHIDWALTYLNSLIGKEKGQVGSIQTYNNNVVQLVTEGGGIRVLSYTSTKREAYNAIVAMTNFRIYTEE